MQSPRHHHPTLLLLGAALTLFAACNSESNTGSTTAAAPEATAAAPEATAPAADEPTAPAADEPAAPAADEPAASASYTCNSQAEHGSCTEFPLESHYMKTLGVDMAKEVCETHAIWSQEPCPSKDLVGTCDGSQGERHFYYQTGARAFTVETANSACTGGDKPGVFEAAI